LGGLPVGTGNLGGDGAGNFTGEGAIDFTLFAGNQYFTVPVPEPTAAWLAAMALVGIGRFARRK
jgi:hypothetical protein